MVFVVHALEVEKVGEAGFASRLIKHVLFCIWFEVVLRKYRDNRVVAFESSSANVPGFFVYVDHLLHVFETFMGDDHASTFVSVFHCMVCHELDESVIL